MLSEDGRMTRVMEKLEEYARKGIPDICLIDPRLRTLSVYSSGPLSEAWNDSRRIFPGPRRRLAQTTTRTSSIGYIELRRGLSRS